MWRGEHHAASYRSVDDGGFLHAGCLGRHACRVSPLHQHIPMQHLPLLPWIAYLRHLISVVLHDGEQLGICHSYRVAVSRRAVSAMAVAGSEGEE